MSTFTLTVAEFLLARITEDEAATIGHIDEYVQRERRECEAKRRIVNLHRPATSDDHGVINEGQCVACVDFHADYDCEQKEWPCPTLRALASVYADHAAYEPHWA